MPLTKKTAYERPYKSRRERRDIDRRKNDESNDYKFLLRAAGGIALLLVVALVVALKGLTE